MGGSETSLEVERPGWVPEANLFSINPSETRQWGKGDLEHGLFGIPAFSMPTWAVFHIRSPTKAPHYLNAQPGQQ